MVVCIDAEQLGKLIISQKAYDKTVAGIISGTGGIETGMMMVYQGTPAHGEFPVALTGRVYCLCDIANGSIEPGDLLTTSNKPGHAMNVTNYTQAQGTARMKSFSPGNFNSHLRMMVSDR